MASKSQSYKAFGIKTGRSPATFAKINSDLDANGLGEPGGWGGGKNTVHVGAPYLRNLLLGSAAYLPSAGAEVVQHSHRCEYFGSALILESITRGHVIRTEPEQVSVPELGPGSTIASYISDRIEAFAAEPPGAPQTMQDRPLDIEKSLIRLDFDPFAAQVEWRAEGGLLLVHYFLTRSEVDARRHLKPEDAAKELARIRHSSILPASLLFTAAQLLADGWAKRGRRLSSSGQGGATSSATPENEKTPGLPEPGVSVRHSNHYSNWPHWRAASNQPHTATRPSNSLETTEFGTGVQPLSLASVRRPTTSRKDALHHAQSSFL